MKRLFKSLGITTLIVAIMCVITLIVIGICMAATYLFGDYAALGVIGLICFGILWATVWLEGSGEY